MSTSRYSKEELEVIQDLFGEVHAKVVHRLSNYSGFGLGGKALRILEDEFDPFIRRAKASEDKIGKAVITVSMLLDVLEKVKNRIDSECIDAVASQSEKDSEGDSAPIGFGALARLLHR